MLWCASKLRAVATSGNASLTIVGSQCTFIFASTGSTHIHPNARYVVSDVRATLVSDGRIRPAEAVCTLNLCLLKQLVRSTNMDQQPPWSSK